MDKFKDLTTGQIIAVSILAIGLLFVLFILSGWIVALLWNSIMPTLFGLAIINTKQGVIIYLLCRLLFTSNSGISNFKD